MAKASALSEHRRAPSALFDIELDDAVFVHDKHLVAVEELKALLDCNSKTRKQLLRDAEQAREIALHGDLVDLPAFAEVLASRGHLICLRTGKPDGKCCPQQVALRHTFVVAGAAGRNGACTDRGCYTPTATQLFVVEPSFRDHFLLSNATPTYQALCEQLPSLFVGTAAQLVAVVGFMCTQMQIVFAETASSCPPWRTAACMISKWLPSSADDVPVLPHGGGAAASDCVGSIDLYANGGPAAATLAFGGVVVPGCGGIRRTISNVSSASTSHNPFSSEQLVYTPRASKAPYYARNDSNSNVLLCGSLVGLGDSPAPVGVFAAAADADMPAGNSYHSFTGLGGDISCMVYSGSSPDSWTGKPGYLGAAAYWGGGDNSCSVPASGLAIKAAPAAVARNAHELVRAEAAVAGSAAAQRQRALQLPQQQSPRSAGPASVVAVSGLAPLDISRFDSGTDDIDSFFSPRTAKIQQGAAQQGQQGPAKRRPGLVSQTSALSAAIAGKPI